METIAGRNKKCVNEKAILKMEQLSALLLLNPAQRSFILLCCADPSWQVTSSSQRGERTITRSQHSPGKLSREKGQEGAANPSGGRHSLQFGSEVTPSYYTMIAALMRMSKTPSAITGVENSCWYSGDSMALHGVAAGSHLLNVQLTPLLRLQRDTVSTLIQQRNMSPTMMGNFQQHKQGGSEAAQGQNI